MEATRVVTTEVIFDFDFYRFTGKGGLISPRHVGTAGRTYSNQRGVARASVTPGRVDMARVTLRNEWGGWLPGGDQSSDPGDHNLT